MNIEIFEKVIKAIKENINPSEQQVFSKILLVLGTVLLFLIIFNFSEESKNLDVYHFICLVCTLIVTMGMLYGVLFGSRLVKYSIFLFSSIVLIVANSNVKKRLLNAEISESLKQILKLPLDYIFATIIIFTFIYSLVDFLTSTNHNKI